MARELTPAELDELLAAYALDAVDPEERAQIETWLERSPNARREVDELVETASLLAESADAPSDDLWSRIEARLGDPVGSGRSDAPQLRFGEVVDLPERREADGRSRRRRPWLLGVAAALALAVAVGVGVVAGSRIADQSDRIDQLAVGMEKQAMERAALAATMEPDARTAELSTDDGHMMAKVVVTPSGRGYFMSDAMPKLPAGRTYQLWAVMGADHGGEVVSAGVMGRSPHVMAFKTDAGVTHFMVTEEKAPGVSSSGRPVMIEGSLA